MDFCGRTRLYGFCQKAFLIICTFLLFPFSEAAAAQVDITSETILRYFERDIPPTTDNNVFPAYEYLQVDVEDISNDFSVHLFGWGRLDLADSGYFTDDTAGSLLYGYLEYQNKDYNLNARIGRQSVYEGVANETLDGIRVASNLAADFAISVYGGRPVALDTGVNFHGDSIWGGRLSYHRLLLFDIGLSSKQITNEDGGDESFIGADFAFFLPGNLIISGLSTFNLETDEMSETLAEARFNISDIDIRPYFQLVNYADYFSSEAKNVNLFNSFAATNEELRIIGGDVTWHQSEKVDVGGRIKSFDYDEQSGEAFSYTALLTYHFNKNFESGAEFGHTRGDRPDDRYMLGRVYLYMDNLKLSDFTRILSVDLQVVDFDQAIYGEKESISFSVGTGASYFQDTLKITVSADYNKGPYFDDDFKLWFKAIYNFKQNNER